jgi:NTE family protein
MKRRNENSSGKNSQTITRPRVGLALSGGGARGLAHIGVFQVLEREGIPIDYVAGTSMGGVIGAAIATGMSSADLEQISKKITSRRSMLRLVDPGIPNGGIVRGNRLLSFFEYEFGAKTFADLSLPLSVMAVDIRSHQEVVINEGKVSLALRATTSIPGVFTPFELGEHLYVDGGLLNNLPVDVIRKMGAEKVIAVDIGLVSNEGIGEWISGRRWIPGGISKTLEILDDCLYTIRVKEQEHKLQEFPPDVLIRPVLPTKVNSLIGYHRVDELIDAGEKATGALLPHIKKLLNPD